MGGGEGIGAGSGGRIIADDAGLLPAFSSLFFTGSTL